MKKILFVLSLLLSTYVFGVNIGDTNEVVTVNQDHEINSEGVATMEAIATNAVLVQIAIAKAQVAAETAVNVTNAIQMAVDNIMSNRVIIYRRGFVDSFAALTILTDEDTCSIVHAEWKEQSPSRIVVDVDYVCSADVSALKPNVYTHNTLVNGKVDFTLTSDANVTDPSWTTEATTVDSVTYEGYYTVTVTIPNPSETAHYFLFIKLEGNDPGGTGAQLTLKNGVKGGITGWLPFGDKEVYLKGGLGKEVRNATSP